MDSCIDSFISLCNVDSCIYSFIHVWIRVLAHLFMCGFVHLLMYSPVDWCIDLSPACPCVYVHLPVSLHDACLSVCQPAYLSVCPPVCLSACPSVCLSVCLSVHLPVSPLAHLSVCLSVCLPARLRPKGRPGSSDVSPLSGNSGLSVDSVFLSALLLFLVLLLFLASPLFCFWPSLLPTFHRFYVNLFIDIFLFLYCPCV